jgi:hypothetical protein
MVQAIGVHVTSLDTDREDGITVTSGALQIRVGDTDHLEEKITFIAALLRTGQLFSQIDVRYVDAPSYS